MQKSFLLRDGGKLSGSGLVVGIRGGLIVGAGHAHHHGEELEDGVGVPRAAGFSGKMQKRAGSLQMKREEIPSKGNSEARTSGQTSHTIG
jgi:hypothetical protein